MNIIRWCNENNGFLTAILSLIGLVLSVTAIVVSIRTARLPYKKKLMLGSYMSVGASMIPGVGAETQILGMSASATNVGNRTINITYLGYAIKKDGRYNMIYPVNRDFDGKASLKRIFELGYDVEKHGKYDRNCTDRVGLRFQLGRKERIGKKYQWIK